MVVDVPGNSTSNNVCKCNEAEGYKAKNIAGDTDTLEAYHCLPDGSQNGIQNGISNITSITTGNSEYTSVMHLNQPI